LKSATQGVDKMKSNNKKSSRIQNNCLQNKDTRKEKTDYLEAQPDDPKIESVAREILKKHKEAFKDLAK
jgi:hypothetical protein